MIRQRPGAVRRFDFSLSQAAETSIVGMFILALVYSFFFADAVILPIFLAALISIVLRPMVRGMARVGVPEGLAAAVVILGFLTVVGMVGNRLMEPANEWIERAPQAVQKLRSEFGGINKTLESAREATDELEKMGADEKQPKESVTVRGPTLMEKSMSYTYTTITQITLTLVLLFFFLALGPRTLDGSLRLLPFESQRQFCRDLIAAVQGQLGSYLRWLTVIYFVLGVLTTVAMWLLDMPNPGLWGAMAFLLGFVPFIGPLLTTSVIALVSVLTFDGLPQVLMPVAAYGFLTLLEGFFITPAIIGRTLTLSPFAIFVSIVFWSWIWGFAGAILAVPILASVKIIVDHAVGLRTVEEAAEEYASPEEHDEEHGDEQEGESEGERKRDKEDEQDALEDRVDPAGDPLGAPVTTPTS